MINEIQKEKLELARFRKLQRRRFASQHKMSGETLGKMQKINEMKLKKKQKRMRRMRRVKRNILSLYTNVSQPGRRNKIISKQEFQKESEIEAKRIEDGVWYRVKSMDKVPDIREQKKSPIRKLTGMIREFAKIQKPKNMTSSYSSLRKVRWEWGNAKQISVAWKAQ